MAFAAGTFKTLKKLFGKSLSTLIQLPAGADAALRGSPICPIARFTKKSVINYFFFNLPDK